MGALMHVDDPAESEPYGERDLARAQRQQESRPARPGLSSLRLRDSEMQCKDFAFAFARLSCAFRDLQEAFPDSGPRGGRHDRADVEPDTCSALHGPPRSRLPRLA